MNQTGDTFAKKLHERIDLLGKSIIEIGCGDGRYSEQFAAFNPRKIVGVDPFALNVQRAETRRIENAQFMEGSLIDLPVAGGHFDVAIMPLSLHRVPIAHMDQAIREAVRVVHWDAFVVVLEPGFRGSFFEAEIKLGLCGGDKTFAKRAAIRAMRSSSALTHVAETFEMVEFEITTLPEFSKATRPTADVAVVIEYLRKERFKLTAEFRTNVFRVL